jgi:hypothetical protein
MFSFNKYDTLMVHKTDNDTIMNLEYRNLQTYQKYSTEVNLKDNCYIDNIPSFIKYLEKLDDYDEELPIFEYYINPLTKISYVKITFSLSFCFNWLKKRPCIVIDLPQVYTETETNIDVMNDKIKMLERTIKDNEKIITMLTDTVIEKKKILETKISELYIIPYISEVCEYDIKLYDSLDNLLIQEKAVRFCEESYFVNDAHHFDPLYYHDIEIYILCDINGNKIVNFGCIFYCFIECNKLKIARLIDYEIVKASYTIVKVLCRNGKIVTIILTRFGSQGSMIEYDIGGLYYSH